MLDRIIEPSRGMGHFDRYSALGDYPERRMVDVAHLLAIKITLPAVEAPPRGIFDSPPFLRRQRQVLAFGK
jgi:hypothetical protein